MSRQFRTVQKVSGVAKAYRPWKEWSVGDIVIGKYVDSQNDRFTQKPCPVIEVEAAFFKGAGENEKYLGRHLVLNATGMLNKAFDKIVMGQYVQVQYDGKSNIESGPYAGKESHITRVDIVVPEGDDSQLDLPMGEQEYTDDL